MGTPPFRKLLGLLPNTLSLSRLVLGICFPFLSPQWRIAAVAIAILTDFFDGITSRWLRIESPIGRLLDPTADKCFVFAVLATWVCEGTLKPWQLTFIGARDIVVLLGGIAAIASGKWSAVKMMVPSLLGKLATAAQFVFFGSVLWLGRADLAAVLMTGAISVAAAIDYVRRYSLGR